MHFSSIILAASIATFAVAAPSVGKRASKFQFFGASESGAEFGDTAIPGELGKDYTWPVDSSIDTLSSNGMNIFRIPFLMEREIPTTMTGSINQTYHAGLVDIVTYITGKGDYALIDPHNYGRYYGNVITDYAGFQTWWTTVATEFKSNANVIFDCNNEPHDMGAASVPQLMQACIDGVRAAGATSQYIFVEGTSYSGAWTWVSAGNDNLGTLTDPSNKIVYEMHQYLDSDGSGTSTECVNATIGSDRIKVATQWLKDNSKMGIIGEFAGGNNAQCISAITDMLTYMGANTDVWMGALWWGAGPWWGTYIYGMEPPSGIAYVNILPSMVPLI